MKHRTTQLGVRKNPDSPRVHGLRLAASSSPSESCTRLQKQHEAEPVPSQVSGRMATLDQESDKRESATAGENTRRESHFLTVHEVAVLLQVPVSWVYERMRKRSSERLPGYRLGKYWRFSEDEILAWVKRQRGGQHVA